LTESLAYVALGSNLGNPINQVRDAVTELARLPDTHVSACSSLYRSKPVGYQDQPDYINAVVALQTTLTPRVLLDALLDMESRNGRQRTFKNAPRTLDLDLLLYDQQVIHEPGLTLPHPRMLERAFVLVPLMEIAPDCVVPKHGMVRVYLMKLDSTDLTRLPASATPSTFAVL